MNRSRATHLATVSRLLSGAAAIALGLPASALAQTDGEEVASGQVTQTNPVLVIGTKEDARLSTGSAVVIDEEELEKFESTNIHSVLRSAPGVYLREEDGLGTFPRIGIRASSSGRSDRISIMEDGIPAAMAPYANTSAYYFPSTGRLSGVEVLKGPEILRYGPQTTSGAINLLSTPIPETLSGYVNAEVGDWSTRRIHTGVGGMFGQFGILAETYQHVTDGFQEIDRSSRTAGNDVSEYMVKLRWRSPEEAAIQQQLDVKLFSGENDADVSYLGLTDADFRRDPERRYGLSELERMNNGRKSASLQHQLHFTPTLSLISTAYYTKTFRDYTRLNQINGINISTSGITSQINNGAPDAALLQGILDGTADTTHPNGVRYANNFQTFVSSGVQFEGRAMFETGKLEHELMGGVRFHEDKAKNTAKTTNLVYHQINGSLVFQGASDATPTEGYAKAVSFWVGDRIRLGGLTLLPLVRHEDIKSRANVDDPNSARNSLTKTTFGFGLNYELTEQWTILAGVHEGFAPPGSTAVEGSKGEESTNFEGGVRFRRGSVGVDLIGFYTDYENALRNCLVASPCANGAVDGVQQDGAKEVYGLEVGVVASLFRGAGFHVPLRVAYTYTDGEYTRSADVASGVRKGDVLDYTPKHIGQVELGLDYAERFRVNVAFNYQDDTCTTTTCGRPGVDTRFLKTQSLFTTDLLASYSLTKSVDLYARVENVFDEHKITHRGADGARGNPGRYFGGGVRATF